MHAFEKCDCLEEAERYFKEIKKEMNSQNALFTVILFLKKVSLLLRNNRELDNKSYPTVLVFKSIIIFSMHSGNVLTTLPMFSFANLPVSEIAL